MTFVRSEPYSVERLTILPSTETHDLTKVSKIYTMDPRWFDDNCEAILDAWKDYETNGEKEHLMKALDDGWDEVMRTFEKARDKRKATSWPILVSDTLTDAMVSTEKNRTLPDYAIVVCHCSTVLGFIRGVWKALERREPEEIDSRVTHLKWDLKSHNTKFRLGRYTLQPWGSKDEHKKAENSPPSTWKE